jgi:hypothetical protein
MFRNFVILLMVLLGLLQPSCASGVNLDDEETLSQMGKLDNNSGLYTVKKIKFDNETILNMSGCNFADTDMSSIFLSCLQHKSLTSLNIGIGPSYHTSDLARDLCFQHQSLFAVKYKRIIEVLLSDNRTLREFRCKFIESTDESFWKKTVEPWLEFNREYHNIREKSIASFQTQLRGNINSGTLLDVLFIYTN